MPAHGAAPDGVVVSASPTLWLCLLRFVDGADGGGRAARQAAGSPACSVPGQAVRPLVRLHRRGKGCPRPPALPTQLVQGLPPGCLRACDRVARPVLRRRPTSGQRRPSRVDTDRNSPGPNAKGAVTSAGRSRCRHWIVLGRLCIRHWWCKACRIGTSPRLYEPCRPLSPVFGVGPTVLRCRAEPQSLPHPVADGAPLSPNPTDPLIYRSNTTYKLLNSYCTLLPSIVFAPLTH